MQYILTEQEYHELVLIGQKKQEELKEILQDLCTKVADNMPIKFWQRTSVDARFSAAWHMVTEFLKMKGKNANKPRLRRSVQNIKRLQN